MSGEPGPRKLALKRWPGAMKLRGALLEVAREGARALAPGFDPGEDWLEEDARERWDDATAHRHWVHRCGDATAGFVVRRHEIEGKPTLAWPDILEESLEVEVCGLPVGRSLLLRLHHVHAASTAEVQAEGPVEVTDAIFQRLERALAAQLR